MSDTTTTAPPTVDGDEAERRLLRPTEGRVAAGVAAGLAAYFGLSPVVYRVAFAALVLLAGSGLILYAAAWLVIPDERRGVSVVEDAIGNRRHKPVLLLGVVLVGIALVSGIAGGRYWTNPGRAWLPLLAIGLALVWWQLQRDDAAARSGGASGPTAGATPPGAGTPPAAGPSPAGRRRLPVFATTMGVVLTGTGILAIVQATGAVDVNWTIALGGGVVLIGVAIAVGAFFGGVGGLAAVGMLLAAALLAVTTVDIPLHGPLGGRTVHPKSVFALQERYRQSIGQLQLDLGDLRLPADTTHVHASVGIGHLVVLVPRDARVELHADVSAGDATLFGVRDNGWDVNRDVVAGAADAQAPTLVLDADVGLGELEVKRA